MALPVKTLALMLGLKTEAIREALAATADYQIIKLPKKSGGYRTVYQPPAPLKKVQKLLLKKLFKRKALNPEYETYYGIDEKTSFFDHAFYHSGIKYLFQFDLKDAFQSVNLALVQKRICQHLAEEAIRFNKNAERVYYQSEQTAEEISKRYDAYVEKLRAEGFRHGWPVFFNRYWLTTLSIDKNSEYYQAFKRSIFSPLKHNRILRYYYDSDCMFHFELLLTERQIKNLTALIMRLVTFHGILPQGTPTAPKLFLLGLLESGLLEKINEFRIKYREKNNCWLDISAYIDNFAASSQQPIAPEQQRALLELVESCGWQVNPKKTSYRELRHGQPLVTGLRIGGSEGPKLPKAKVKRIRAILHQALSNKTLIAKAFGLMCAYKPLFDYGDGCLHLPSQLKQPWENFSKQYSLKFPLTFQAKNSSVII